MDELIKESKAIQLQRQQQEERLRTEEGLKRQQSILEHDEDIQELMDFFHKAGPWPPPPPPLGRDVAREDADLTSSCRPQA